MFIPKLNDEQLKMIANIISGMGQAFFAASVLPFILGLAHPPIIVVSLILIESIVCWILAIAILGEIKK